jgi:Protein of unknown function, DUF547
MSISRLVFTLLFLSITLFSISSAAREPGWSDYRGLLRDYVRTNGAGVSWVDYSGISRDARWPKVLERLARYPTSKLKTRSERLAFYINAYNILTIRLIVKNWPLQSIRDLGSFFVPVWKKKAGMVAGKLVSLSDIGQDKLRPLGDLRSYFALACGSASCPDLRRQPYTARRLNRQLDDQARRFLNNRSKGLSRSAGKVRVSKLFSWFKHDFNKAGGVRAFVERYKNIPDKITLRADLPYNWSINGG